MNNILERIVNLSQMLGNDTSKGSVGLAVLKGYAAGIEMILNDFIFLQKQLSPISASGDAFLLFCNLFGIDSDLADDEKRIILLERHKEQFGEYTDDELKNIIDSYDGVTVSIISNILIINIFEDNIMLIEDLAKILREHQSPSSKVIIFHYKGLDFDYWDSMDYDFNAYDRLSLPFYILDQFNS